MTDGKKNASKPSWIFRKGDECWNTFHHLNVLIGFDGQRVVTTPIKGFKGCKSSLSDDEDAREFSDANGFECEVMGC